MNWIGNRAQRPTVAVEHDGASGFKLINAADFNPEVHKEYAGAIPDRDVNETGEQVRAKATEAGRAKYAAEQAVAAAEQAERDAAIASQAAASHAANAKATAALAEQAKATAEAAEAATGDDEAPPTPTPKRGRAKKGSK